MPRSKHSKRLPLAAALCVCAPASVFAAPDVPHEPFNLGQQVPQMLLSLGLVLVAIFAIAWLSRRFLHTRPLAAHGGMRIVSGLSVGPRERIVVLEVGAQQLLVGLSPGRIETLHVFPEPVIEVDDEVPVNFTQALRTAVQNKRGGGTS